MAEISRKEFLKLSAATAASLVVGRSADAAPGADRSGPTHAAAKTLIRGADVLTMESGFRERLGVDVLIEDGRIVAIDRGLPEAGADVIEACGMILMPGMVDGHRHLWEYIDMGRVVKSNPTIYADNYMLWKVSTVVAMSPEDHYIASLVGGLQAIDSGVTSVLDYAHGQDTADKALAAAQGVKDSGIGGWFAFQLGISYPFAVGDTLSFAQMWQSRPATSSESQWQTAERLMSERFSDESALLQLALAPHTNNGSSLTDIKEEWARVRASGVNLLAAHLHRPEQTFPSGFMGYRDSGIADLHDAGLLGPDYHAAHANRLTADELSRLRDTGGMVCATTMGEFPYMTSGHRGPSVHGRARAAGVATGIGTDVAVAVTGDYFEHVRASLWNHYLSEEGRDIVRDYRSADTLDFATAMGAAAIRLGDVTGSIVVGKRADLVLLKTDRIGFGMAGSLADRVVTFANTSDVDSVWIAGVARKRHGRMLGVDWAKLRTKLAHAQQRVAERAATVKFV